MSEKDDTQRERIEDLAAAYALGALTEEERREFDAMMNGRPDLLAEVEELVAAANLLALSPQQYEPSSDLRRELLSSIGAATEAHPGGREAYYGGRRAGFAGMFGAGGLAAAAAVAVVAVGLLVWALSLQNANEDLRTQVAEQRQATQNLQAQVEDRRTLDLQGSGAAEDTQGELLLTGEGQGVLVAEGMPPAPQGSVYEAWVLRDGMPEPAGLFVPREGGATAAAIEGSLEGAEAVAVTIEPEGGSPMPTSDPVLTASLA